MKSKLTLFCFLFYCARFMRRLNSLFLTVQVHILHFLTIQSIPKEENQVMSPFSLNIKFHLEIFKVNWVVNSVSCWLQTIWISQCHGGKNISHYYCTFFFFLSFLFSYDGNALKTLLTWSDCNEGKPTSMFPFTCCSKDQACGFSQWCMKYDDLWSLSGHSAITNPVKYDFNLILI